MSPFELFNISLTGWTALALATSARATAEGQWEDTQSNLMQV